MQGSRYCRDSCGTTRSRPAQSTSSNSSGEGVSSGYWTSLAWRRCRNLIRSKVHSTETAIAWPPGYSLWSYATREPTGGVRLDYHLHGGKHTYPRTLSTPVTSTCN